MIRLILIWAALISAASPAVALDYFLEWEYDQPIGKLQSNSAQLDGGYLIYESRTGQLTYKRKELKTEIDKLTGNFQFVALEWQPPNLASFGGLFDDSIVLPNLPITSKQPHFSHGETINDVVVPNSNVINLNYDPLFFWPHSVADILNAKDLATLPHTYQYGKVLPEGLSAAIISNDLHAANGIYYELVYVVPEPATGFVGLFSLIAAILWRHNKRRQRGRMFRVDSHSSV